MEIKKEQLKKFMEKLDKINEKVNKLIEQLPKDIEKGSLHQVLGYDKDFNL
jgi:Asp-tRNA(Asn)/Glu-tRNA(Gln) amidotransferase C subunit